ncbi:hypothetical protein [Pseudomonas mediterranea]|uniref:hypothetical protein n=1 Tax=Pseudomonas mediterranea TaxID=183795 RepID=UPI0006D8A36B|nr:hypothetical protein [Pseudomonas mediterranea]
MNDTSGLASSQHFTFTSEDPAQDLGLPTASLRAGWADELCELAHAQTREQLALSFGRAGGWAAALVQAEVIGPDTFAALDVARCQVHAKVLARIEAGQ